MYENKLVTGNIVILSKSGYKDRYAVIISENIENSTVKVFWINFLENPHIVQTSNMSFVLDSNKYTIIR